MIPDGIIWRLTDRQGETAVNSSNSSGCCGNGGGFLKTRQKEGFSLIELMIAMAITVIVMAGIITLIAYSTRSMNLTQARAALQDQAKDSVNHISIHVMEGSSVAPYNDVVAGDSGTRGAILIQNKNIKQDGTEEFSWDLYWVSAGAASGDPDMLCFAPLADLAAEASQPPIPDEYEKKKDEDKLPYLASLIPAVETAGIQKRHMLCDDVEKFECKVQQNEDPADSTIKIGRESLYVSMTLKDDKSEFKCDKEITMRNQKRG